MDSEFKEKLSRRQFTRLAGSVGAVGLVAACAKPDETATPVSTSLDDGSTYDPSGRVAPTRVKRNLNTFTAQNWQPYFKNLNKGAILVDTKSRALHYWAADGTYRLWPCSVPMTDDLTRLGRTTIVRKVVGPSWTPTPSMRRRDPSLPAHIPPGADNPLGSHALYLGWKYYRIHGTHDNRKIGRRSSSGCIGLYNHNISELFAMTQTGTQVLLI